MPNSPKLHPAMRCRCCAKPIPMLRRGLNMLTDYCDPICFAAGTTLKPIPLTFWRAHCQRLAVSMHQARFDSVMST